jgi:hypothetical protein
MLLRELHNVQNLKSLVREFIREAESKVHDWFGSGTFDEICTEPGNCAMVSERLSNWLRQRDVDATTITVAYAKNESWAKNAKVRPNTEEDAHTVVLVDGTKVIDLTARQFDPKAPFPKFSTYQELMSEWKEIV